MRNSQVEFQKINLRNRPTVVLRFVVLKDLESLGLSLQTDLRHLDGSLERPPRPIEVCHFHAGSAFVALRTMLRATKVHNSLH